MGAGKVSLEEFGDPGQANDTVEPGQSPDFLAGLEQGRAEGRVAAEQEQTALRQAFVDALEDLAFTTAEARHQVMAALQPVLEQVANQVIPSLIAEGYPAQLVAALETACDNATSGPMLLHVPPNQVAAVEAVLSGDGTPDVTVVSDPTLADTAARIAGWDSESFIDLEALITGLQEALHGLIHQERNRSHG